MISSFLHKVGRRLSYTSGVLCALSLGVGIDFAFDRVQADAYPRLLALQFCACVCTISGHCNMAKNHGRNNAKNSPLSVFLYHKLVHAKYSTCTQFNKCLYIYILVSPTRLCSQLHMPSISEHCICSPTLEENSFYCECVDA